MVKSLTYIYYPTSFCAGDLFWKFSGKFDVFKIFCCRISDCRRYQAPPMGALRYMITDTALHSNGSIKNTFCNIDKYILLFKQIHFAIYMNIFSKKNGTHCNKDKYILQLIQKLQFRQIHFAKTTQEIRGLPEYTSDHGPHL